MTLAQLVKMASSAYPDDLIGQSFNPETEQAQDAGDGLARFIAQELVETFDPDKDTKEQLHEAARAILSAAREIHSVAARLDRLETLARETPDDKLPVLAVSKDEDERTLAETLLKESRGK